MGDRPAANGNSYTYDSENHMISATGNGKTITMVYDAFGNRVAKTVNGLPTKYLVEDDVNPTGLPQVLEEVLNGAAVRTYTYGLQRISENQIINSSWTPSFYVYDGGGNVRQLTNASGAVTDEYEYDAYGNSFTKVGTTPNNYLYRGEQYDSDLGLYYLRARYYNPATGRFLSRDPEDGYIDDPASLHKYLYANGDPVNNIDPRGRGAYVEVALPTGIISATAATAGLYATSATLGCLLLWEGGNVWAQSVVASNGGYVQQLPCFALPMSKGGKQKVDHPWVWERAKNMPGDPCQNLQDIMDRARKGKDWKTFLAAKATKKALCK